MSDWTTPTSEEVSGVVGYLVDDNLRRQFFAELQNPTWVAPLDELKVFDDVPPVWEDEEGVARARPWSEGEYLARMAAAQPDLVTRILLRQPDSDNPWVNTVVLDAALELPPGHAAPLAKKVAGAIRRGWSWVDPQAVVRLADLVATTDSGVVRDLLAALFEPRAGGEEATALGTRTGVTAAIDDYWYRELAPHAVPLLAGLGMKGLKLATGWLLKAVEISASPQDLGALWRPSIAPHEQNFDLDEIMNALIDMVHGVAAAVAAEGSLREVVEFLRARDLPLTSRIAVEVTAQLVQRDPEPDSLDVARQLLLDESLLDMDGRPEYVHLARALLPRSSQEDIAEWQTLVDDETWQGPDDLMRRIAAGWEGNLDTVTEEEIARVRRRMTYRLLLPLGEALPTAHRETLAELRAEFGELGHPEFVSYSSSFVGPNSPVDHVALGELQPSELFAFLRDFQPDGRGAMGSSVEGLARELAVVAEHKPEVITAVVDHLLELPRSYVRAALSGWAKAIPAGFDPPLPVWDLMTELAAAHDGGDEIDVDFDADDPTWRWAQRSALDLVSAYVERLDHLTAEDARQTWAVVAPLTGHPDPTTDHEERYGGDNMDPLTLSLNTTRPAALRVAIEVLGKLEVGSADTFALRGEILDVLARHASPDDDPSLAVAAVFGESLGRLAHLDLDWVNARADLLLDVLSDDPVTRARADVVVSVALRVYRTSPGIIALLRVPMKAMFSPTYETTEHVEGWRGRRRAVVDAATHMLRAYVLGFVDEDDPLVAQLTTADAAPGLFAEALGQLGWEVMHALRDDGPDGGVAPGVIDRAKRLIDKRVEAIQQGDADSSVLTGFYWWIRAGAYDPSWWLPILRLAATDPGFDPKGLLGEALATAADSYPELALDAFEALRKRSDGWERYDMLRHAPRILAAAIRNGNDATRRRARDVLDELGRSGHLSILADVDRLIGDVT